MPETTPPGASRGGRGRASFHPDAGRGGRARGQGRNLPQRQASPDRMGLAARRGEGRPRYRCQARGESNGSPYEATDRPRGGALARAGAPRLATRSPRRRQRPSPRGARRSPLPRRADACAVVRVHGASVAALRPRPTRLRPAPTSRNRPGGDQIFRRKPRRTRAPPALLTTTEPASNRDRRATSPHGCRRRLAPSRLPARGASREGETPLALALTQREAERKPV
jgi:hypothetical protein